MCKISHSHFFSIMLFVLPFRTEHSTCFILSKVCHFVGRFPGGGGVLPYKGLMGTCGQPGYVFRDFCLKQGIEFIIFCLNQGIDLSIFVLNRISFLGR